MQIKIYTDGGSLRNPGKAAIGYLIYDDTDTLIARKGEAIGDASNNVAEYTALIKALNHLRHLIQKGELQNVEKISCFADSELMVKQLNGVYKIKHADMRKLAVQVKEQESFLNIPIQYRHVLREKNKEADALVKAALQC